MTREALAKVSGLGGDGSWEGLDDSPCGPWGPVTPAEKKAGPRVEGLRTVPKEPQPCLQEPVQDSEGSEATGG